jgi:hypothetical protein
VASNTRKLRGLRDAVRAEDDGGAIRHFGQLVDEDRAARAQAIDDEAVVHHFMAHVNRGAERFQCTLHDLDRAIDTGTESTGIGEQDIHAIILPR